MPWPFWPSARLRSLETALLFLLIFLTGFKATPQWNNQNDFYSNSYQYQHGFLPISTFNNQYGMNNNFGAFNRPFITKPGSFVPYGNNFGATVSGGANQAGSTSQASHVESDESPPHTGSSTDTHSGGPSSPPLNIGGSIPGTGSQVGSSTDHPIGGHGSSPTMPAGIHQMAGGPMNNMNQMGMTGVNDMMASGYGAGTANNNAGQWPGNIGMTSNFGGNCYGPGCNQNFPGTPALNPNGFDYPNTATGGMPSNLGQNVGAEDYNSAEESAEIAGGEGIEQANLQRYAEYLNMMNRRYGIGMPGQVPNTQAQQQTVQPNPSNVIAGGSPQGTGSFTGNFMGPMDMNAGMNTGMMPNFYGSMNGMSGMNGMQMAGMDGFTNNIGSSTSGITGGVSSVGSTNPLESNTPSGTGAFMSRYSAQPQMSFGSSGIVGYGSYMPSMSSIPNIYDSQTYQPWPMSSTYGTGSLTNLAPSTGMGIMDGYAGAGTMPAEYMGMGAMSAPAAYGYSGIQYPMTTQIYPQNVIPAIYQTVAPSGMAQSTVAPIETVASKSREKSSQESSAISREHIQSPPPATSIQALTQQIRRLPAVLYVESKDQDGRRVENLLRDTYGLPLVSFYVDKIDKPKVVEKYLHQLTAHKGLPYLFICGTFIGSQEHVENYHKNKQIPQLVEYVCGEEKDKKNSSSQRQSSHKDKKKKSSSRHKSRRQSRP